MSKLTEELISVLEAEEQRTVGNAFGGTGKPKSFSLTSIRNLVVNRLGAADDEPVVEALRELRGELNRDVFPNAVICLIRFSFLIELTNLTVGSTKMKTRWLPGRILMPQSGSFEPIQGVFEPGNDPRSSTAKECLEVLRVSAELVKSWASSSGNAIEDLKKLFKYKRVPYEFLLTYQDASAATVHAAPNVRLAKLEDLEWNLNARSLLANHPEGEDATAIKEIGKTKINVKVFKTDRALTGKDKTNRARRWEVLCGDFQHATLEECWSAERKLTEGLVGFEDFPRAVKEQFERRGLVAADKKVTRCPVTLEPLRFPELRDAILNPTHGTSQYQVGHLHPLKKGGKHCGDNVCWQSADGNRIQGDLSIEQTESMLDAITRRRAEIG